MSGGDTRNNKAIRDRGALMKSVMKFDRNSYETFVETLKNVGSRTPTGAPAWVTLDVLHGGFASGSYAARLEADDMSSIEYLRTPAKMEELESMLNSGKYTLKAPENAAFLVLLWLLREDKKELADKLVVELAPWMETLRFYPYPEDSPMTLGANVSLTDVGQVREDLNTYAKANTNAAYPRIAKLLTQQQHASVWLPLEQRAVELILLTLDHKEQTFVTNKDGSVASGPWPFQLGVDNDEWLLQVSQFLSDYEAACKTSVDTSRKSLKNLVTALTTINQKGAKKLTGKVVGRVRRVLAGIHDARGFPGSEKQAAHTKHVTTVAPQNYTQDFVNVILNRLKDHGARESLEHTGRFIAPVTSDETTNSLIVGRHPPEFGERILNRALEAPLDQLIELNVINSAEAMAPVVAKMNSVTGGSGIDDDATRNLYIRSRLAFTKRRSLLLLNLAAQVRLHELPWMPPLIQAAKDSTPATQYHQALRQSTMLWWRYFPQTLLPNPLCKELSSLMPNLNQDVRVSLMEELAADIFMYDFSKKFTAAAEIAAVEMQGTLYERYYGLEDVYKTIRAGGHDFLKETQAYKETLEGTNKSHSVADGGRVIEAAQLITTHNLVQLLVCTRPLPIGFAMGTVVSQLSGRIVKMLGSVEQLTGWHDRLRLKKDIAYAFRHQVFFLSHLDSADLQLHYIEQFQQMLADTKRMPQEFKNKIFHDMVQPLREAVEDIKMSKKPVVAWFDWALPAWQ